MNINNRKVEQVYLAVGAALAWFAVAAQFYLILVNRVLPVFETIIKFFSYFTILTNIIVALCFTALLIKQDSKRGNFLSQPKVLTATAVYITVVGIVYNLVLRSVWNPQGLQLIVDELLHSFIPTLFVLYWWIFAPKNELQWKDALRWLLYPLTYFIYILIRGKFSGQYPYPFIDVGNLGYYTVYLNSGIVFVSILLISFLFIAVAKSRGERA